MRKALLIAAALLLTAATPSFADIISFSVDYTITTNLASTNDNYWGYYTTAIPSPSAVSAGINTFTDFNIPSVSFTLPSGIQALGFSPTFIFPTGPIQGTGVLYTSTFTRAVDPSLPSTAPTFGPTGSSNVGVYYAYLSTPAKPVISGNQISTGTLDVTMSLYGNIYDPMLNPGANWQGYIAGSGQVTIPYTIRYDVYYNVLPVPEPQSFVLLGTGILGLAAALRRRL